MKKYLHPIIIMIVSVAYCVGFIWFTIYMNSRSFYCYSTIILSLLIANIYLCVIEIIRLNKS
jgi:hypothetical protein